MRARCLLWAASIACLFNAHSLALDEMTWHWGRDRTIDLQQVLLELELDPAEPGLTGRMTMDFQSLKDGLEQVQLDLVDLHVGTVTVETVPVSFTHRDGILSIALPNRLDRGEFRRLTVAYHGVPTKGLYWVRPDSGYPNKTHQIWSQSEMEDARYWWPTWDFPNDRATSEVRLTVPSKYKAISNGRLQRVEEASNGFRTWVWRMDLTHVTYLTSVAIGEWDEASEQWEDVPLHYYVPKGRADDIPRTFSDTADMMEYFSELTGRKYPYGRYNQVVVTDFIYGGMENIAATTLTESTLHDERAHVDSPSTGLVAHELAHQWFGDLITCENWAHTWLNEGFATYLAALYIGRKEGVDEFHREMAGMRGAAIASDAGEGRRPVVSYRYRYPFDLFDGHAYSKGGFVLHMLRDELGDEEFFRAIRSYVDRQTETVADTGDLQDAVEESSGRALSWFFRQWLFRPGNPEIEASWSWEADDGGEGGLLRIDLAQTQAVESGEPEFRFPLVVRTVTKQSDGNVLREDQRIEIAQRKQNLVYRRMRRPDAVVLDPEVRVLASFDVERTKDESMFLLRHGGNAHVRAEAANELGGHRADESLTRALVQAMKEDGDRGVRGAAAAALGKARSEEGLRALLEFVQTEPDSRARRAGILALGEFEDSPAVRSRLRKTLDSDSSYAARGDAIQALAKLAKAESWPTLKRALSQPSHREVVRSRVFSAAATNHMESALPTAVAWSVYGKPSRARTAAIDAIGRLGWEREEAERRPLVDRLVSYLDGDPNMFVRASAATALGRLGLGSARTALSRAARIDPHERVRRAATDAIDELSRRSAKGQERGDLLRRIDTIENDNRELRERLETLESRVESSAPEESKSNP